MAFMASAQLPPYESGSGMELLRRRYELMELLNLRLKLPVVICNLRKITPSVLNEIIRVPQLALKNPLTYSCYTKDIEDIFKTPEIPELSDSDEDGEQLVFRGHIGRRAPREVKWYLRRRDLSSRSSATQPLSAPTSLAAQKADNFRKFYRAVVSPTHVRVTAGGRIVPNNRPLPPPRFTWNKEKLFFETDEQVRANLPSPGDGPTPWMQGVSIYPDDTREPSPPFANPSLTGAGPPLFAPITANPDMVIESQAIAQEELNVENQNIQVEEVNLGTQAIKISPPGQFDTTKPFMYNGQLVFPVPPGFQAPPNMPILPITMLGAPTHQHLFGPNPAMGFHGAPSLLGSPVNQTPVTKSSHVVLPSAVASFGGFLPVTAAELAKSQPHVQTHDHTQSRAQAQAQILVAQQIQQSTVIPAFAYAQHATLRRQIQMLEHQLRQIENQLQNNKHQIDEQQFRHQRTFVSKQLDSLRSALEHVALPGQSLQPSISVARVSSDQGTDQIGRAQVINSEAQVQTNLIKGEMKLHSNSGKPDTTIPQVTLSLTQSEPSTRKRLSAAAALAPPFQPRSQQAISAESSQPRPKYTPRQIEGFLAPPPSRRTPVSSNTGNNDYGLHSGRSSLSATKAESFHGFTTNRPQDQSQSLDLFHKANHPEWHGKAEPSTTPISAREVTPYLMGFPPPGMTFEKANGADLVYSRPLTSEELRARHLYWGKAPSEVSRGLPKFDGRDFYPASPVKETKPLKALPQSYDKFQNQYGSAIFRNSTEFMPVYAPASSSSHNTVAALAPDQQSTPSAPSSAAISAADEVDDNVSLDSWGAPKKSMINEKLYQNVVSEASPGRGVSWKGKEVDTGLGITSKTRAGNHPQGVPNFFQGTMRNNPIAGLSSPMTGVLSPTTAQGYLPPYRGAAVASLAPSMSSTNTATFKFGRTSHHISRPSQMNSDVSMKTENRPPGKFTDPGLGAADMLRRVNKQDQERQINPDEDWNTSVSGIGPVSGDW